MRYDTCTCGNRKQARSKRCSGCADNGNAPAGSSATSTGPLRDEFTVTGNTATLSKVSPEEVRTEDDLVRVCKIDLSVWEIVEMRCSASQVMNVPRAVGESKNWSRPSTEPVTTQLFHISAKLRRKVALIAAREEVAALLAEAKRVVKPRPFVRTRPAGTHMLELAIPDLHIGKLAWAPETGGPSYDVKIAQQVFRDALEALVERTAHFKFEKVFFPIGQDLLHSDTFAGTTTAGTRLDVDSRFQKSFTIARLLMTEAIDRLRQIAPVHAMVIEGNHNRQSSFTLGAALECQFHNTPDVVIDNAPRSRKYLRYGDVMLMLTHGDKGKKQDYPLLMATEESAMFGATRFRECHTGHLHSLRVQEHHGVKVRISPALCPADAWHAEMMFTGNARGAEAFVWHPTEGLVTIATYTVPEAAAEEQAA